MEYQFVPPLRRVEVRPGRAVEPHQVAFLDAGRWESSAQFAAQLRRAGVRTLRLTTERSALKCRLSAVLFTEVRSLTFEEMTDWLRSPGAEAMADLQITDEAFHGLIAAGCLVVPTLPSKRPIDWLRTAYSKTALYDLLLDTDVRQPRQVALDADVDVAWAAEQVGWPLLLKDAHGSCGHGVAIATDQATLDRSIACATVPASQLFLQQLVDGDEYGYGCVTVDGEPIQEVTYRKEKAASSPFAQVNSVTTVQEDDLVEAGRRVVRALGGSGLLGADFMRDGEGRFHFIDLHPRPWGVLSSLVDIGVDLSAGYRYALGLTDEQPTSSSPPAGITLDSFPSRHHRSMVESPTPARIAAFLKDAARHRTTLGTRYTLESTPLSLAHVARSRRPRPT